MAARARLRAQWRELFKSFGAVICPVMPTPAHLHDHSHEQDRAPLKLAELIEREFGGFVPPLMFDGLELVQPSQPVRKVDVRKRRARFEW
jgi:hypothetical protein